MDEERFQIGVKALVRDGTGRILICRAPGKKWDLPGGRINRGETIGEALRRELKEELGIEEIEVGRLYEAVISSARITSGSETYGLCLLVYNCKLPNREPGTGKGSDEHIWSSKIEANLLLSSKYSADFLDSL